MAKNIILNALHSKAGGGFMYLKHILPSLAKEKEIHWTLLIQEGIEKKLDIPKNIKVITIPPIGGWIASFAYEQCILPFKLKSQNYDAVLCNANYVPLFVKNPIPILHSNCDVYHYAHNYIFKAYWLFMTYLTRLSVWRAPKVFSVAQHMYDQFAPKRAQVKFYHTPPASIVDTEKKERDALTLFAVGDAYLQKNYTSLLKSFSLVVEKEKDAQLVIAGGFPFQDIKAEIQATLTDLNLEENVHFLGIIPYEEVLHLYETCTLYVSTSDAESFSMTLLEALSHGCICVVKDTVFNREVAENAAEYIKLDSHFESSYAEMLLHLLQNKQRRVELSKLARKRASGFSWEHTAHTICEVLKDL